MLEVDTLVVGAGPVGAITAWSLSQRGPVAIAARRASSGAAPVLELVPAATVELLRTTLGVCDGLAPADERLVAWDASEPREMPGGSFVVERGVLDASIFASVLHAPALHVVPALDSLCGDGPFLAGPVRASRIIDASGRAAFTADRRRTLRTPWIARALWGPRPSRAAVGIRVAALPSGYAVRHVSRAHLVLTLVGARLHDVREHAPFLLEGVPRPDDLARGSARRASVEVFDGRFLRVGDAAFARDALSSQGLAAGLSDGLYAAAVAREHDAAAVRRRQRAELHRHLAALRTAARTSRFSDRPAWSTYASDLEHLAAEVADLDAGNSEAIALVDGRLVEHGGRP